MADLSKAPSLHFTVNTSEMQQLSDQLAAWPKAISQAIARAINDTLKQGRRESARIIVAKYNIKQKDVINAVLVHRANKADLRGSLEIHPARRPGLGKFGSTQTAKGVTYKTIKGQGKRLIPGAYQYPKKNPYWVAIRPNPQDRTKVKFLQGISVWGMFASLSNQQRVNQVMQEKFAKNARDSVNFEHLVRSGQIPRRIRGGQIVRGK
jgi:hypothetical protein